MNRRAHVMALLGIAVLVPAARAEEARSAEARPTFSGHWTLDPEASDDAGTRMKEAMGDGQGRGGLLGGRPPGGGGPLGGGGGPSGGGGGPVGGFGAPPSPEEMEAMRQTMDDALHASKDLLITQDGVSIEIVHDGERVVRLYADGRKNKGSTGIDKRTKWDASRLVTESKVSASFGSTVRITETWAMMEARLAITTRLEGGPFEKAVVIRRLYDRESQP